MSARAGRRRRVRGSERVRSDRPDEPAVQAPARPGGSLPEHKRRPSSWRSREALPAWLASRGVVAIAGIDTRRLTRLLRERGSQNAALMAGEVDVDAALEAARKFPGLAGLDLAQMVTTDRIHCWTDGSLDLDAGGFASTDGRFHVVAYDFGVKTNILRLLADRGCRITVVPAKTPASRLSRQATKSTHSR